MSSVHASFHWMDYLIFSLVLLVSCGIGVYHGWRGKGQGQGGYLMGNRQMNWFAVSISLIVSLYSGVSQLGKPAEVFLYGIQYSMAFFGISGAMVITAYTFMPLFYNLKLTSSYEYLELRFNSKAVRRVAALNNLCTQTIYCGLATYTPSIALEAVTGFPVWASILCVGGVSSFYTMLGGLKAVVWADTFQFFVMTGGFLCIAIFGLLQTGGMTEIWAANSAGGRITNISFDPNPLIRMSFWSVTIGSVFCWIPRYAVNQASVQRCLSVPTLRQARMVLLMNIVLHFVMDASVYGIGLLIYSYFSSCDPLNHPDPEQRISSPNQLFPLFVMKVVNLPGVPGMFLASLFSGSFSTVSSCLNAMAAVTWEDFCKWKFVDLAETTKTNILKLIVLIYGVTSVGMAFLTSVFRGSILQVALSFMDTSSSPLMGLFILGAFFTKTNWLGSIIGCLLGFIFPMWISLGSYLAVPETPPLNTSIAECIWNDTTSFNTSGIISSVNNEPVQGLNKLYTVSFLWFPFIGTMTTVVVGLVASAVTAPFVKSVAPSNIKESHIIFPLDFWSHRKKTKSKKNEALDNEELNELTT